MILSKEALEINELLKVRRDNLSLTFIEDTHTYYMKDIQGNIQNNFKSVSKIVDGFYRKFDAVAKSQEKAKGDVIEQQRLLTEWKQSADYATNMGSRVHYLLEKYLIGQYNNYKDIRQPIFVCDDYQTGKGDQMIRAGVDYIDLMHTRGATLLDTEIVLGDNELKYVGQPDKVWLMQNRSKTELGLVITDWKTNQPKNFDVQWFTEPLYPPFSDFPSTALGHYYIQLPLYGRLLIRMLKGTKYENIKLLGCVVVLLKDDGIFTEYKVPEIFNKELLSMNLDKYLI